MLCSLVQELLSWEGRYHHTWDWGAPGPFGLTPLHLAAVLPDAGSLARVLLSMPSHELPRLVSPAQAAKFALCTS